MDPAEDMLMPMKCGGDDRMGVYDVDKCRGSAGGIRGSGADAVNAFHAVFRAVEEDKGMGKTVILRIGQPGVQKSSLCRGHKADLSRHIQANEPGVPII